MSHSQKNTLFPVLKDIYAYLQQLKVTLDNEHEALSSQNLEKLNEFAEAKQLLIENLEDLDGERKKILADAGMELGKTGVEDYLSRFSSGKNELVRIWEAISKLSRECEKQNNVNGVIIESQRRRTETALDILKGNSGESELYSKKGKSVSVNRKSTSIRA